MDSLEKLKQAIIAQVKSNVPVQTIWATCKSVNMNNGVMVATRDELDYEDVLIGLGGDLVEPTQGSRVLLGLVQNQREACFLIYAEKVNRRFINGDTHGGLVIADNVASRLNAIEQDINALKQAFSSWAPIAGPTTDGGAGLKALAAMWFALQLTTTQSSILQNTTVSHG